MDRTLTKRNPPEESVELYPGLCICDDRVAGSITVGQSRLPIWAFAGLAAEAGWEAAIESYPDITDLYGWTREEFGGFIQNLLEPRGELARLLLMLANAERRSQEGPHWSEYPDIRTGIVEQLKRCLAALDESDAA